MTLHRTPVRLFVLATAVLIGTSACATRGYVRDEMATTHERIDQLEGQVETNQETLGHQADQIEQVDDKADGASRSAEGASQTAREALDRAVAAGKLAEGKLLYETVLSDDQVTFGFDKASLGEGAADALARFAEELKAGDENVFVEIQGHTDATGSPAYNLRLGEQRAEAVRRALNGDHGLPLHRLSVISYGEDVPVADNGTREGRAKNRRVVLVVLK